MSTNRPQFGAGFPGGNDPESDRLSELLADRALGELAPEDRGELEQLLKRGAAGDDADAFDRIAAALELNVIRDRLVPMPESVREKVRAAAPFGAEQSRVAPRAPAVAPPRSFPVVRWIVYLAPTIAAAAILLLALSLWPRKTPAPSLAALRQELIDKAPDAVVIPWTRTGDPAGQSAGGEIDWSNARQIGYMRFSGLEPNDPQKSQYQLWIVDAGRNPAYPVDGGVFDIGKAATSIVSVTPRVHVDHPTLFAVTVERPGGVVVSDRKRLPLLAKMP